VIQAGAAIVLAIVTTWTLIVLRRYAADTAKMAKNSSQQLENSQTPFVALVLMDPVPGQSEWAIRNQGFGVAVDVNHSRWQGPEKAPIMSWATPLGPGEVLRIGREDGRLSDTGFTIEYSSLDGKKFRTFVKRTGNELKTSFQKL